MRGSGLFKPKVLDIPGILTKSSVSDLSPRAHQAEKLGFPHLSWRMGIILASPLEHGSSVFGIFVNF